MHYYVCAVDFISVLCVCCVLGLHLGYCLVRSLFRRKPIRFLTAKITFYAISSAIAGGIFWATRQSRSTKLNAGTFIGWRVCNGITLTVELVSIRTALANKC